MANQVVRSLCGFCHSSCGVKIHLADGRVSRIEGDHDHPSSRGDLCPKVQAIKPLLESEDRLRYPLKKTKAGFVRVSWDEALDFAAEQLNRLRGQYGPESLVHVHGAPVTYQARDGFRQFMGAYGSPNFAGAASLCHVPRAVAFMEAFGGRPEPDYENTRLVVFWGTNPVNSTRFTSYAAYNGFIKIFSRLKEKGVKIVVVDPVRSETVFYADEWIRLNIGTDTALALSMAHTIIKEGLYDEAFVRKWVLGFDEIERHVAPTTPEWAEQITSVSADRIREFARVYAKTDGAILQDGNGLDMHTNGVDMVRAICILIALTGNIDKAGGNLFFSLVTQTPLPAVRQEKKDQFSPEGGAQFLPGRPAEKKWIGSDKFPLFPLTAFPAVKESLINEWPERPRSMIVHHANPVLVQGNQARTKEALAKLDFLMVLDVFPTATTEAADLVLPAAADHEQVDFRAFSDSSGGFVALREKVATPLGESRSVFQIEYDLAKRMGIAQNYPFQNAEQWLDFVLTPSGVTLKDLRNNHIMYASPPVVYKKYEKEGFKTPSGKVQCYSERFKAANRGALPTFEYPKESSFTNPGLSKDYSLAGTTRRTAEFVHTKLFNLPVTRKRYPDPLLMLHPSDAQNRGINQGDLVEVKSPRGKIQLKAKITDYIGPGLVSIDFGWGNPTDNMPSLNLLTPDDVWDPVSGGYPNRLFMCEVTKSS